MITTSIKTKTCRMCSTKFTPQRPMARVCSPMCALELVRQDNTKAQKQAAAQDRRETKAKLETLKKRGDWLKEAKTAAQKFRRLEELSLGHGCMSCGRSQAEVEGTDAWKPGGAWDGGHFLSKGARPELALDPLNIWLQCKSCNAGSSKYARKGYTVNAAFRANLIDRIGLEAVESLEADHTPKHYTIDDLKAIKADYMAKTQRLKDNA